MRRRALAAQQAPPFKIAGDGPTPLLPERPDFVLAPAQVERRHACPGAARGDGGNALQQARAPSAQQAELIKRLVSAARKGDCYIASSRHVYLMLQSCPKMRNIIIAELQYSVVASGIGGAFPLSLLRGRRIGPLTEATASRTTVVEGRLLRISQRERRTALPTDHSGIGLEGVSGQRSRSRWSFVLASLRLYQVCFHTNYSEGMPL